MRFSHRLCEAKFGSAPIAIATARSQDPPGTALRYHERQDPRAAEHDQRGSAIEHDCGCACASLRFRSGTVTDRLTFSSPSDRLVAACCR